MIAISPSFPLMTKYPGYIYLMLVIPLVMTLLLGPILIYLYCSMLIYAISPFCEHPNMLFPSGLKMKLLYYLTLLVLATTSSTF